MNDKVEAENKRALRKIWLKKILKRTLWTFVALYCFFWFYGANYQRIDKYINIAIETYRFNRATKQYDAAIKEHDRLWTADTVGGKTPEETMQMFIDALKANDAEKASKLYVVENQSWALDFYKKELTKNGNLNRSRDFYIEIVRNGDFGCSDANKSCGYSYERIATEENTYDLGGGEKLIIPKGGTEYMGIGFQINPYTNVWKIRK